MLAMVATTPKAAAGLAILRERSDMGSTLPGVPEDRAVGRASEGTPRRSHVLLPIFSTFSYLFLGLPLRATRTMGDMQGSTFRTSPTERQRRRTGGPALTLLAGSGGASRTSTRDARPTHPAQEGFTPDGVPSDTRGTAVQDSEPGSSPFRSTSRGNATLDTEGLTATGSGPNDHRGLLIDLIAEFLEIHAGAGVDPPPVTEIRHIR